MMNRLGMSLTSMNGKIVLLTGMFVAGFSIFGVLSHSTLNAVKVHGPHYNRVVQNKDLLADVLPPPNYIVESYLTAHLMVNETDSHELESLISHYGNLKNEYAERQTHWNQTLEDGPLKHEINQASRVPAEEFFAVLDSELIPALQREDREQARQLLNETLPPLYGRHRASVDIIVDTTNGNAVATESEVAKLIGLRQTLTCAVGIALISAVVALAYWLSRSVRRQEREMSRIQSMVEQAPINMFYADRDLNIQYLNSISSRSLKELKKHTGISADSVLGMNVDDVFPRPIEQRQLSRDPSNLPSESRVQLGPETVDLLISPIRDEDSAAYLGATITWEIVTERLRMEEAVKDQAQLDRELSKQQEEEAERTQKKVNVVLSVVNEIANGRFDVDVPDLGSDAIGQVGSALEKATEAVRAALTEVKTVSATITTASKEMTLAAGEISKGAQNQAARLEETAASLEEITSTVRQNSDNAQEARDVANDSRDIATNGGRVVSEAVQAMQHINEASKQIADIITTIDEIAFQTNLLALNAAVEAARAGEQGRGFAVVAAEVRSLAQRSASSAKEIKSLIEDSNNRVERGTQLVNQSGETLSEIVESVKRVTDFVTEIATASQEQLLGVSQVNQAVTRMDHLTQANASQTEQMAGTSAAVLSQVRQLEGMVGRFQLGEFSKDEPNSASPSGSINRTALDDVDSHPQAAENRLSDMDDLISELYPDAEKFLEF